MTRLTPINELETKPKKRESHIIRAKSDEGQGHVKPAFLSPNYSILRKQDRITERMITLGYQLLGKAVF